MQTQLLCLFRLWEERPKTQKEKHQTKVVSFFCAVLFLALKQDD